MRPWMLSDVNLAMIREDPYNLAVLPIGATEPHNLHLPYGTDNLENEVIAQQVCAAAHHRGARVALLPPIPYGTDTNQMGFPMAMNLNPSTLLAVIRDLVRSLDHHGVHKCLIFNGHGGNDLKFVLRELYGQTAVQLFLCDWFRVAADLYRQLFEDAGDHAGEMETSLIMAFFPELVQIDRADAGTIRPTRFEAVNRGWVTITRPWHLLTTNSGAGNPFPATADKGHRLVQVLVERLSQFLVELSQAPLDERFPFT